MEDQPCTSKEADKIQQQVKPNRWTSSRGGTNCCVPQCSHNSLKNPNLSFYKIPKDGPMQKRWLKRLKTKGLCNIGPKYKVCSAHFQGGKKTFENNIPTIFTVNTNEKPRKTFNSHKSSLQAAPLEDKCVEHVDTTEPVTPEIVEELGGSDQLGTSDEENLKEKITILQAKCNSLEKKCNDVKATEQCLFRMERFIGSDSDFKFYTGFPDYSTFKIFFDYLSPACNSLIYHGSNTGVISTEEQKKCGRKRTTSPEQELFMVLARMRCGLLLQDLAHRYGMSIMNVSRIWTTWLTFLFQKLRALPIWPTRKFVDDNMPTCFSQRFPKTRVILDCTEILIEMPSSCRSQSVTFSSYKHHNTAKGLLGISPNGYPSFVSSLYAGRTSDKKITKDCGILTILEKGDQVMADRGFDIEGDLPAGVTLNIPPFLNGKSQLSLEEESSTRKVASVRVHVERAISRIKNYRILHQVVPISLANDLDKIWTVCSYLTLFLPPLINEKQD